MNRIGLRRHAVGVVGFLLLSSVPAPGNDGAWCPSDQFQTLRNLWADFSRLADEKTLSDPLKQLQPGDILIFPFGKEGEEPQSYRNALEGYRHAALVYSQPGPDGRPRLVRLDSPQPPPFLREEFQGKDPYYVLRPRNAGAVYRDRISHVAEIINELGFSYDALMQPDFLDAKKLQKMKTVCRTRNGSFPDMSCAELVATAASLSDHPVPNGVTLGELLDKGTEDLRGLPETEVPAKVGSMAREILEMFRMRPRFQVKEFTERVREGRKDLAGTQADRETLMGYLKQPDRPLPRALVAPIKAELEELDFVISGEGPRGPPPEIRKALVRDVTVLRKFLAGGLKHAPGKDVIEVLGNVATAWTRKEQFIEEDIKFFTKKAKQAEQELKQFEMAEVVLRHLVMSRVSGKPLDPKKVAEEIGALKDEEGKPRFGLLERLAAQALLSGEGDLMKRRIIRPADFMRSPASYGYELKYFYPGNLPELCPLPEDPGPEPEPPGAPVHNPMQ